MIMKRIFEFDEWLDDFDEEEISEESDIEDTVRQYLIDHPEINYHRDAIDKLLSIYHIPIDERKDHDERNRLMYLFEEDNEYTRLYSDIDYDKIRKGTVVMANIINVDNRIKRYIIVGKEDFGRNVIRWWVTEKGQIANLTSYNIKKVISY